MILIPCPFYFALSLIMDVLVEVDNVRLCGFGAKSRMRCADTTFAPQRGEEVESTRDSPGENYQGTEAEAEPSAHILYDISAPNPIP